MPLTQVNCILVIGNFIADPVQGVCERPTNFSLSGLRRYFGIAQMDDAINTVSCYSLLIVIRSRRQNISLHKSFLHPAKKRGGGLIHKQWFWS
jgi:hypothetical protein